MSKSAGSVQTRQHGDEVCYKLVEMKSTSVNRLNGLPECKENDIVGANGVNEVLKIL